MGDLNIIERLKIFFQQLFCRHVWTKFVDYSVDEPSNTDVIRICNLCIKVKIGGN